jgi:hypothetical protein
LHTMKPFSDCPVLGGGLQCTTDLRDRLLCLPMANDLSGDEILAITSALRAEREGDARAGRGTRLPARSANAFGTCAAEPALRPLSHRQAPSG